MIKINDTYTIQRRLNWNTDDFGVLTSRTKNTTFIICKGQLKIESRNGSNIPRTFTIHKKLNIVLKAIAELINF